MSSKFKVRGIPTLVIVDSATGELITADGRDEAMKDPTGEKLPWHPPTKAERARALLDAIGTDLVEAAAGKPIGLYFSAHWCPPCRGFTPQLAKHYEEGLKDNLHIVFVSGDRDEAAFASRGAGSTLPFERRDAKDALSRPAASRIPTLAVIDSTTGEVITTDGRAMVAADPTGSTLAGGGWLPKPFNNANDAPDALNEKPCVVALGGDDAMAAAVREIAEQQHEAAGKDIEKMTHGFFTAPAGGVTKQIRNLTKMADGENALLLLDIPDGGSFCVCDTEDGAAETVTAATVKTFLRCSVSR